MCINFIGYHSGGSSFLNVNDCWLKKKIKKNKNKESQYMVSHPETGSDSPIGLDRDRGCDNLSQHWRDLHRQGTAGSGASVNLVPYSMYKQFGLGELKPTNVTLSLADRSMKIPKGIVEDVLVKIDKFYYSVDFMVLDIEPMEESTNQVPIILGRPFFGHI